MADTAPFWRRKALAALTEAEWEALCDGCGRCCLIKLRDAGSGVLHYTGVACRLLDPGTCRCRDYDHRREQVADCLAIRTLPRAALADLPPTCAYRRLAEGRELPAWHPLVSGDPGSVRAAGISACLLAVSEEHVHPDDLCHFILPPWPEE